MTDWFLELTCHKVLIDKCWISRNINRFQTHKRIFELFDQRNCKSRCEFTRIFFRIYFAFWLKTGLVDESHIDIHFMIKEVKMFALQMKNFLYQLSFGLLFPWKINLEMRFGDKKKNYYRRFDSSGAHIYFTTEKHKRTNEIYYFLLLIMLDLYIDIVITFWWLYNCSICCSLNKAIKFIVLEFTTLLPNYFKMLTQKIF